MILGGVAFTFATIHESNMRVAKHAYSQGCQDVYVNIYKKLNMTKIDTKSLTNFCDEQATEQLK